jgi:hypothetical protein
LNEEPTCSRLYTAMLTWQSIFLHSLAVIVFPTPLYFQPGNPGPGYSASISPFDGFSSTAPTCM